MQRPVGLTARKLPTALLVVTPGMLQQVPGVLTPAEASGFVAAAEALGFSHQGSRGPAFGEAFRDNDRVSVEDPALADRIWRATGLDAVCARLPSERQGGSAGAPVGLNPNVRLYKYSPGQRFGRHVDDSVDVGPGRWTEFTLLIYLSSCEGGETVFYGRRGRRLAGVAPAPGLALLHRHGDRCLEHEGAVVRAGVKYVLRSDVVHAAAGR